MQRIAVLRFDCGSDLPVNINDEIGLEPYLSYTLQEHLEDLLAEEGLRVVAVSENVYLFSDDSIQVLQQATERVNFEALDEATRAMILHSAMMNKAPYRAPLSSILAA